MEEIKKGSKKPAWKDALNQKWSPHRHCIVCGKAVPPDEDFCAQGCRDKYQTAEKSKSKKNNLQLVLIFGVFIVFMVVMQFMR